VNKEQAAAFIINELGRQSHRDDIIVDLCRDMDIDWEQAEELMRDVEAYHGQTIARRQSPLLIVIGLGIILGGLALTTYGAMFFLDLVQMETFEQIWYTQYIQLPVGSFVTGTAMIVGGIIGFRKIFAGILN
jgi:hypothetical protein